MQKSIAVAIVMISWGLSGLITNAQEPKSHVILFHVTSVRHAYDSVDCKYGSCSVMKYTVEGYADVNHAASKTQFVITCNELVFEEPRPHRDNICARFHAGDAYLAQLQSEKISFPHSELNKDFETDYSIVAENEVPKGTDDKEAQANLEPREATNGAKQAGADKGPEQLASRDTN